MSFRWPSLVRHFVQVALFCAPIAALTQLIWPQHGYGHHLVRSLAIGLITWGVIETGARLVDARHSHVYGAHLRWPKGWRGLLLVAVGIGCGFLLGDPLGAWLTGAERLRSARDDRLGLLITIGAGVAGSYYFHQRGKAQALLAAKARAERDATEAHLRLLQSQLEPHMLFNTLANLRALIGVDPPAAQAMLDTLNGYLRATLDASRATAHPLGAEFERLRDYLGLMAIRMGPRLAYELRLPDGLRDWPVPPLLLQPLVENAIQHGLEPQVAGGRIDVSAAREGSELVLTVRDDGLGFDAGEARAGRFGMAQVRERVATAYGGRGRVDVQSQPGAGTTIRITLPLPGEPS